MKVLTYIRRCNKEQLAQFLTSCWWTDKEFNVTFKIPGSTTPQHALIMETELFNEEIPELINFDNSSFINTKTRRIE